MTRKRISTFAIRLRQGLEEANMKASRLAALTGIDKSSISHYLKGDWEGKQDAVFLIAKVLNVSEAWLMGYDVPKSRDLSADSAMNEDKEEYLLAARSKDGKQAVRKLTKKQYEIAVALIESLELNDDENL